MSHHAAIQDHNPAGHRGTRGGRGREPAHYDTMGTAGKKKRKEKTQTLKTIPQSLELHRCCFQLAAYGFSVLVDRIISSKCNHNSQAAMFGLAMRACGNLPRSLPSAVATGGSPRRCRSPRPPPRLRGPQTVSLPRMLSREGTLIRNMPT